MIERPILFSGPMVLAILEGRKTQTRRVVKPQPAGEWAAPGRSSCPYGQPGDWLWVRETWAVDADLDQVRREHEDMMPGLGHGPYFRADPVHEDTGLTWHPSIRMPRWASRITLEVTGNRVERLQDISDEDARAEGVELTRRFGPDQDGRFYRLYRPTFIALWDSINAKRAPWASNPWVWCISFKRLP